MAQLTDTIPWKYDCSAFPPAHTLAEQPIIFMASISLILGHCNVLTETSSLSVFAGARRERGYVFLVRWKKGEARCVSLSQLLPSLDIRASSVQLLSSE